MFCAAPLTTTYGGQVQSVRRLTGARPLFQSHALGIVARTSMFPDVPSIGGDVPGYEARLQRAGMTRGTPPEIIERSIAS